jgi:lantibiotic modifying enzyme
VHSLILNWLAGNILGLLHLYDETKLSVLKCFIEKGIEKMIENANFHKNGLCWEFSVANIQPLCGFSHGNSGIAFLLIEAGHYFKNDFLLQLAESAMDYETKVLNHNLQNWPDYRNGYNSFSTNDIHFKNYSVNNNSLFFEPRYVSA